MKITYEFDTDGPNWDSERMTRDQYEHAFQMLSALSEILDKTREWYKYDQREAIPTEEIRNTINGIIDEKVPDIEELIYG